MRIFVDLDGTLAHYDGWKGKHHIGEPIWDMVNRVKEWLEEGREVVIFTARVHPSHDDWNDAEYYIRLWCHRHIGRPLRVTCMKEPEASEFWDDCAVAVEKNTGVIKGRSR